MDSVEIIESDTYIRVIARGGTRRERGARIGATVRGRGLVRIFKSYSETYGFQSATYVTYRR